MTNARVNFGMAVVENIDELSAGLYKVLTSRRFRVGPLPTGRTKELVLQKIKAGLEKNRPVLLLQFWGGCKNPNLRTDSAELCEEATLDNLNRLNLEIKKHYAPALKIFICPGDSRVERVNLIPAEKTKKYVETLTAIAGKNKYAGLFTVIPVSRLYEKYSAEFEKALQNSIKKLSGIVEKHPDFKRRVANARKNVFCKDMGCEQAIRIRSENSARDYVIFRVAEEEAEIYREFNGCIRSFFIKYTPFYRQYISASHQNALDCALTFFTGKKGNITQPWQALGRKNGEEIIFLSQERLKKASTIAAD